MGGKQSCEEIFPGGWGISKFLASGGNSHDPLPVEKNLHATI